jgi:hypothetical protein
VLFGQPDEDKRGGVALHVAQHRGACHRSRFKRGQ